MHETLGNYEDQEQMTRASVYKWAREISHVMLLQMRPCLQPDNETKNFMQVPQRSANTPKVALETDNRIEVDSDLKSEITDHVHRKLLKECERNVQDLYTIVSEVLDYFLPLSTNHALVEKCWGAFEVILDVSFSPSYFLQADSFVCSFSVILWKTKQI